MIAVHLEDGVVSTRQLPIPRRPEGFALLRLRLAGICNTDLELQRGYYGFRGTPGHEFVAEVAEADTPDWVGKRVSGEINLACGECERCRAGMGRHCARRTVLGIAGHPGAFAGYFVLPERNLHALPEGVSDERAVFLEPLAAACEILDQVAIPPGEPVAVLGDGKLGLLVAQVLHLHGCRVRLYGKHEEKLRLAAAAGIETGMAGAAPPAEGYGYAVEATGSPSGLRQAVSMMRPRGTLILKSTVHGEVALDMAPVVVHEIALVGSRCGRFEAALPLLADPRLRLEEMVADRFPLAEAPAAFARAAARGTLKVLLTPE